MAAKTTRRLKRKPTPKQRLKRALREARARGVKPMTELEFDKFLEETGDPEPERDSVDDFLALIRRIRRYRKRR